MLEPTHLQLSMRRQCDLLNVSRSSLYYRPVEIDSETLALMRRLDEFYTEYPDLGHRRLVVLLAQEGKVVNVKRVRLHSDGKRVFLLTGNFRLTQPIRVALAVKQYLRS